jgi:hypothetical protein
VVLAVVLVGLDVYQRVAVNDVYDQSQLRHRIFWHNIGIGFALNHVLAQKYSLLVDDWPMMRLVREHLIATNRAEEIELVFMPPLAGFTYYGIARDYVRYDQVAREVVFDIARHNKWQTIKTFLVDKPLVLWRQLTWAAGYQNYSLEVLHIEGQRKAIAADDIRRTQGLYLNPLRLDVWIGLSILVAIIMWGQTAPRFRVGISLAAWIATTSLIPNLVAYPIISAIAVALTTIIFAGFVATVWLLCRLMALGT